MGLVNAQIAPPAKRLLGLTLEGDWKVVAERALRVTDTGGLFSTGYTVELPTGQKGFLKAMDYSSAFGRNPSELSQRLEQITKSINFERELLDRTKRLDRVVTAVSSGTYKFPGGGDLDVVEYLIFELAQCDVRRQMDSARRLELAWSLRALHHIATGLHQLHRQGIAHQDLKPSNVLVFQSDVNKIGDLGRAACRGLEPPHHDYSCAGDLTYAPPRVALWSRIARLVRKIWV